MLCSWQAPGHTCNYYTRLAEDKNSSLFGVSVIDYERKVYKIDTSGLYYKRVMIVIYDYSHRGLYYKPNLK